MRSFIISSGRERVHAPAAGALAFALLLLSCISRHISSMSVSPSTSLYCGPRRQK